ncbi:cGMP-dependent protein kinase, isozyme 1 [Neodiprion lecontei]|uniref:cGMP-dependent protein kinase n=1 Tax=Neodiprion lecontei TaxID=441921 RepID=A0A6J0C2W1_NEOLC|nr:cGMP-dependent protein kinase, isozyme 1 [Neodiprion lecontei]
MMKFSCFPTPSILGQRGSINLPSLSGAGASPPSPSQVNATARGAATVMSYKRSDEPEASSSVIQPLPKIVVQPSPPKPPKRAAPQPPTRSDVVDRGNERKEGVIGKTSAPVTGPIPVYNKDPKSREQIKNAILNNNFLGNLDEAQVEDLVSAMHPKLVPPGTLVIRQGDIGSHLYVSAEGEFNIFEGEALQSTFGPGVAFGELALLYNTKRLRSIQVKSGGKVWILDRGVFRTVMMRSVQDRLQSNIRFLRRITIFQSLPEPKDHVLAKISDLLRVEFFPAGTRIVRQGEEGHKFYIIRGGTVKITKDTLYGGEEQMVLLDRGKYFGEKALLNEGENRRQANAIAMPPGAECLTLDRQSFLNYLGALEEIRTKDWMAEYDKQKKSLTMQTWISEYANLKLSDLECRATLGVGGFGRVELVVPKSMPDKSFALKLLKKKTMVDQQQQEHVLNEKWIMQACSSPFICKLYQTYKDRKYVYFLMEVCLGGDVWTTLQQKRFFNDPTSQFMVGCVVEALDHLHSLNIVYRDLKPENLMLDSRGYLKLVDFGFSKKIGPDKTWTFAGTPEYVAPEIILNKGHDRAVDYWALGILTHELLVGKPPFRDHDHMSTYNKILKGIDAVSIPNIVNKSANNFIRKLLRQSPSERLGYQRAGVQEIRDHKWFGGFNWEALREQSMSAPIIPEVRSHIDTKNFGKYPADTDLPPDEFSGWDQDF